MPEIEERTRNRRIPQNFIFDIAQVILQSDKQGVVRPNEEVMALAKAKRRGHKKAYYKIVYEDEI
jgi:hypothetical protein